MIFHLNIAEGQAISARWRLLAHKHLLQPPPHSRSLVKRLASVLEETGSFSSAERPRELVQSVALQGIETIIKLSVRLESAFMVEVTSSDLSLLFEAPDAMFDDERMIDEFGPGKCPPGRRDRIAGTTEVGVRKRVSGRAGKGCVTKVLLKAKVVLERDVCEVTGDHT